MSNVPMSKKFEKDLEVKIEKAITKKAEYVVTIIINLVLLIIFDNLPDWIPFLSSSFNTVLPLFYFSYIAIIVANGTFFFYDNNYFKGIIKGLLNLISIIVLISVYYIFPFNFSAYSTNWDLIARILILIAIFGTAIGTIFEVTKACTGKGSNSK